MFYSHVLNQTRTIWVMSMIGMNVLPAGNKQVPWSIVLPTAYDSLRFLSRWVLQFLWSRRTADTSPSTTCTHAKYAEVLASGPNEVEKQLRTRSAGSCGALLQIEMWCNVSRYNAQSCDCSLLGWTSEKIQWHVRQITSLLIREDSCPIVRTHFWPKIHITQIVLKLK